MSKVVHIFGSGISGATLARLFANQGHHVYVYEKRDVVGGNCYDYLDQTKIRVQKYGPHFFHTDNKEVWNFIRPYMDFQHKKIVTKAKYKKEYVPLPINFKSIDLIYSYKEATLLKQKLLKNFKKQKKVSIFELLNAHDKTIVTFGKFVFDNFYKNYSVKMWGIPINKINPDVINRLCVTIGYEQSYFPLEKWQGNPKAGYTQLIKNLLNHKNIEVILNHDANITFSKSVKIDGKQVTELIFFCGPIDELLNYRYGKLPYRSLNIAFETLKQDSFQPVECINYPAHKSMTRITEHKKIGNQRIKGITIISKEYPGQFNEASSVFNHRYYPINNARTDKILNKYLDALKSYKNFHLLGRLAQYKYFDMDDAIANAFAIFKKFKSL